MKLFAIKKLLSVFFVGVCTFCFMPQPCAYSQFFSEEEKINMTVYDKINPSIVAVNADVPDGTSSGTGCVIDPKGVILTSRHVIEGASVINVTTSDGGDYTAKLIAVIGENSDLALIKINPKSYLKPLRFGDSNKVRVGQRVLAIGNPFGFNGTLTEGIVSRIDQKRNKIQTDASINPGSSGGPLLNMNGEIIGINQSIYNPDNNQSNIGIGFAVPVNAAKTFVSDIKNKKMF